MEKGNKNTIVACIWDNPAPVFGMEAKQRTKRWELDGGKFSLIRKTTGEGLTVLANHGSNMGGSSWDVFTFLQDEVLHTAGFKETLLECGKRYGVTLEFSEEERKTMKRAELVREIIPSLIASLNDNKGGAAAKYIEGRGFTIDNHFGELTKESIQRAKDHLKATGKTYEDKDLFAELERLEGQGYNLVIPYYHNGSATGLKVRNIKSPIPTGSDGKPLSKYKNVTGLVRNGYCDRLKAGVGLAVCVEGELDAIALIRSGVQNVVAMGGASMSEEAAGMLNGYGVKALVYIPDVEQSKDGTGEQRTDLIDKAVRKFQQYTGEDMDLYISVLPDDGGEKMDAADYYRKHGGDALIQAVNNNTNWWDYELCLFEDEITARQAAGATVYDWEVKRKFMEIYNRCNPIDRQRMKETVRGSEMYRAKGITPEALEDVDEQRRQTDYTNRVKAAASDLTEAIESGANPVKVAEIVKRLGDAQRINTAYEWNRQVTTNYEDMLEEAKQQPETLKTKWKVGDIDDNSGEFIPYEEVEYYPADITVFCAPTSHGKTMILLQSALDMLNKYPDKLFLYVSCEEIQRQLLERAINVHLDIPTTNTGKDNLQNPCFIEGTRKKAIKAALRGDAMPVYGRDGQRKQTEQEAEALRKRINDGVAEYGRNVFPRLKLIHTEGSTEGIANNLRSTVRQYEAKGYEVGAVFVDYMQLLSSEGKNYNRTDELKEVCNVLSHCAEDLELPIIIAAQLNRLSYIEGIDKVTLANIGEGADIERKSHDVYLIWQVDKTKRDMYFNIPKPTRDNPNPPETFSPQGDRSKRIFTKLNDIGRGKVELKKGYLYIEQLKARDGKTGGWGLLPFNGEAGRIDENDIHKMKE